MTSPHKEKTIDRSKMQLAFLEANKKEQKHTTAGIR
jgi:hypothetical protein